MLWGVPIRGVKGELLDKAKLTKFFTIKFSPFVKKHSLFIFFKYIISSFKFYKWNNRH